MRYPQPCIGTYRNASAFILQDTLFRNAYGNNKIQRQPKITEKKKKKECIALKNFTKNILQAPFHDGEFSSLHTNYTFTLTVTIMF